MLSGRNENLAMVLDSSDKATRFTYETRTHSMARHRKSPRSQRNLTVIDPLTLPKAPGGAGTQKIVPVHVPFM